MKTSELKGAALDWAVAKCNGVALVLAPFAGAANFVIVGQNMKPTTYEYSPSTSWAQGGPIIGTIPGFEMKAWLESSAETKFEAHIHNYDGDWIEFGSTMLEAAMRCYVASKLGDDVDIPEELAE